MFRAFRCLNRGSVTIDNFLVTSGSLLEDTNHPTFQTRTDGIVLGGAGSNHWTPQLQMAMASKLVSIQTLSRPRRFRSWSADLLGFRPVP
jgi:hypothetical protein